MKSKQIGTLKVGGKTFEIFQDDKIFTAVWRGYSAEARNPQNAARACYQMIDESELDDIEENPIKPKASIDIIIQAKYDGKWEDVSYADDWKHARQLIKDYRENEPNIQHRVIQRYVKREGSKVVDTPYQNNPQCDGSNDLVLIKTPIGHERLPFAALCVSCGKYLQPINIRKESVRQKKRYVGNIPVHEKSIQRYYLKPHVYKMNPSAKLHAYYYFTTSLPVWKDKPALIVQASNLEHAIVKINARIGRNPDPVTETVISAQEFRDENEDVRYMMRMNREEDMMERRGKGLI